MASDSKLDRRSLLRRAAVMAGAAATVPLLGEAATAQAGSSDAAQASSNDAAQAGGSDADTLFKSGKFEQAGRAYEEILEHDPTNLHAAYQRGYVALLSNRFAEAEKYLGMALKLAPTDMDTNKLLGDCYIRQDKFSLSVPRWQAAGEEAYAQWFGAVRGEPYQVHGDITRVPWQQMDPEPLVEASVNGGPPKSFSFYTGYPWLGLSSEVAKEAGLSPVAKQEIKYDGVHSVWQYFGVLDSFKLGDIELRNVPVEWDDGGSTLPQPGDGMIGTWVFYHLLTTFDYAGQSLILRRPTREAVSRARTDAKRAGAAPLPLWLAFDHMLHSRGSIAGSRARNGVMAVNLGGATGESVAGMPGDTAKQLGVRTDYDRPLQTAAHSHPTVAYPCYPKEIRLGDAAARELYCEMDPSMPITQPYGFDVMGHFAHCFYKPYHVTLDFTDMKLYIARGKPA